MTDSGRREFLLTTAAAALGGAAVSGCAASGAAPGTVGQGSLLLRSAPIDRVRIGFVGVGGMGTVHLENFLAIEGVEVRAVCDILEPKIAAAQQKVVAAGQPRPAAYGRGPRDFERMCAEQELDLVFTATPWEWHVPVCLAAMASGKHAATEVPAAMTVQDCWALVEASERYQKHCVMMENCCYDRREMLMFNLVRQGVFGELLHGECGYLHDLRGIKFSADGEGLWRRAWSERVNANLYPTHGIGPLAQCFDINRGNQFEYLVSMSGPSRGLQAFQETLPAADPRRRERYVLGDVNLTLIRTVRGQTLYLVHDTNLPRPYSRINMIQGTRGLMQGWPDRIHVEGRSAAHRWESLESWFAQHEHPLWRMEQVQRASRGHGGMDYLEDLRLIQCLRRGEPTDMNVYDAAAWSCIVELTQRSVAQRSRPQDIPDFTRGRWRTTPPLGIIEG